MTLKEYKEKYKLHNAALARLFKVSEPTVHRWLSKGFKPGYRNAAIICKKTNGEVTLQGLGII